MKLSNEEDEIDKLVQQHNLEQGVTWDEDELDREDENDDDMHDIDLDLSVLDQEIATLSSSNRCTPPGLNEREGGKEKTVRTRKKEKRTATT